MSLENRVKVELNVNHSVETAMPETTGKTDGSAPPEMLAKPNFDVEIKKGNTTITFSCSFASEDFSEQQPEEEFGKNAQIVFTLNCFLGMNRS